MQAWETTGYGPRIQAHAAGSIRPETADDREAVRQLLLATFPTSDEARLVERLRGDGDAVLSLVAVEAEAVVGHVLFSRLRAPAAALALAPLAVRADRRRGGIGARLVTAGLDRAKREGWQAVIVLGDPTYYRRFGFRPEAVRGMASPYAGPALMGLAFAPDGLQGPRIEHAPAFASL